MQNPGGSSTITASVPAEIIKESRIQPVWHVIVLNLLTVCFYAPIWFYKNARDLSNRLKNSPLGEEQAADQSAAPPAGNKSGKGKNLVARERKSKKTDAQFNREIAAKVASNDGTPAKQPVRMSVRDTDDAKLAPVTAREKETLELVKRVPPFFLLLGMALPGINLILGIYFFKMLAELYPQPSSIVRRQPVIVALALSVLLIGALCLCKLPKIYFLLYCPAVCIPLSIAQHWLNSYWQSVELDEELLVRHSFSTKELVMLIAGIMLLGLIIAGFYIVPFDVQH